MVLLLTSVAAEPLAPKDQDRPVTDYGPAVPDAATKAAALMQAYRLNGNSMVRWGSIDLSQQQIPKVVRVIPLTKPDGLPKSGVPEPGKFK